MVFKLSLMIKIDCSRQHPVNLFISFLWLEGNLSSFYFNPSKNLFMLPLLSTSKHPLVCHWCEIGLGCCIHSFSAA